MQKKEVGHARWCYNSRGKIALWVCIAALTLIIMVGAIVGLLREQARHLETGNRKAVEISEYGLFLALDKINEDPAWSGPIPKTEYEGGAYSVSISKERSKDSISMTIISTGVFGSQTKKKQCVLARAAADTGAHWTKRELE
ncbi:MAG: hypothetical protein PHC61_14050 [Chitinivibrionales bacterium]|nr:hypothetical protein [Chitinivibrionales bacterium]